ncbi:FUSC family protein [Microbacterium sp. NPDC089695]|uniref:FUSC family protein n=1 Tax=Microbacterium sp. NPDC089695 TaxID=3364198 RepID=UPI00382AF1A9
MTSPIAWSWRNALHGIALALPAAVVMLRDPTAGLALAVGVLPAMALGVGASRRQRLSGLLVGVLAGAAIVLGAAVGGIPVLAVVTVFVACVAVAVLAADPGRRLATPLMILGLPLIGTGLSFGSIADALPAAGLIVLGSAYAVLVSMLWPDRPAAPRPARSATTRAAMLVYGIQIGLAGALAAAIGFALGVDHPGWACTAALMVSRPQHALLVTRGWGRALAVLGGAVLACGVAALRPPAAVAAVILVLIIGVGTATAGSRWYVFPFFPTFVVLSLLLLGETASPAHWFVERVGMTLVGVALALGAADVVPRLAAQRRRS